MHSCRRGVASAAARLLSRHAAAGVLARSRVVLGTARALTRRVQGVASSLVPTFVASGAPRFGAAAASASLWRGFASKVREQLKPP